MMILLLLILVLYHDGSWELLEKKYSGVALGMLDADELNEIPDVCRIVDQELLSMMISPCWPCLIQDPGMTAMMAPTDTFFLAYNRVRIYNPVFDNSHRCKAP